MTARDRYGVWAPRARRLRLSVGDDIVEMRRGDDDWWTPADPVPYREETDYGYLIDDSDTPRIRALSKLFSRAGFKAPVAADIRLEIWTKLLGNLTFNPVSALTHATLAAICLYPLTRALAVAMMEEAKQVGEKLGIKFRISIDKRIAGAESIGEHKTSMLQDVEAGRILEVDALLGSVIELGRLTATPTPHLDAIYACTKLLGQTLSNAKAGLKLG